MLPITDDQVIERLIFSNPWWQTNAISDRIDKYKRRYFLKNFNRVIGLANPNRAVVLMGPRRVGKTIMIYHAIDDLLKKGVDSKKIFYLSIDVPIYTQRGLEELFNLCKLSVKDLSNKGFYVFFDEVQYLKDWEIHLKTLVDSYPDVKFIASGSAAAALKLKSNESGAGRFSDFYLPALNFIEFLGFSGYTKGQDDVSTLTDNLTQESLAKLNEHFINYINYGGYPEAAMSKNIQENISQFVGSDIIDKVLLRDLPSLYGIKDVQELYALFNTIAYNTGQEFSIEKLSQSTTIDKNTIRKYLTYLEAAYLIEIMHRIDNNGKEYKRANNFKIYLTNTSLRTALFSPMDENDEGFGYLVETAIVANLQPSLSSRSKKYYARWPKGEIDFVTLNKLQKPIAACEVKWSDRFVNNLTELSPAIDFLLKNNISDFMVTSKTIKLNTIYKGVKIRFFPAAMKVAIDCFRTNIEDADVVIEMLNDEISVLQANLDERERNLDSSQTL